MKNLLLVAFLATTLPAVCQVGAYVPDNKGGGYIVKPEQTESEYSNPQKEYAQGWDVGYKAGWCYGQGYGCIEPIVPICPIPRIGESGFKAGYNRGFLSGLNAHKE